MTVYIKRKADEEYIKRGDVREHIQRYLSDRNKTTTELMGGVHLIPPADVKPVVRGEWRCVDDDKNIWKCTHCGDEVIIEVGTPFDNEWYYCSHCGADMQKHGEEED